MTVPGQWCRFQVIPASCERGLSLGFVLVQNISLKPCHVLLKQPAENVFDLMMTHDKFIVGDPSEQVKFVNLFKVTVSVKFACDYDEARD